MDNETTVVNTQENETPNAPSTSEMQTQGESVDTSSEQSREDTNTPEDANEVDPSLELKEKSANRFQELANENSRLREEQTRWEEERNKWLTLEQQMQQQAVQAELGDPNARANFGGQDPRTLVLESKLARLEEEQLWGKAIEKYPELKKDKKLDNIVYRNYVAAKTAGENVTPSQIADEVMGWVGSNNKRITTSTYEQAENDIAQKVAISSRPTKRSSANVGSEESAVKKARELYKQTGDERHLADVLDY